MADRLRFDTGARYGAALVGVLFAGYLNIATDFSAFIQASNYAGSLGTDVPLVNVVQFLTIVGLYVASFSIMPVDGARRVAAVTLACTVLFTWATLGIERGTGSIVHPVEFWQFVLNQGFITLIVGLGGWFIVRGRRFGWIAFPLVLVPPIMGGALDIAAVTSGTYTLTIEATVVVSGLVAVWLGAVLDATGERLLRLRRGAGTQAPAEAA